MQRVVAVRVPEAMAPESLPAAMLEDVVDLVAGMQQVDGALVATPTGEASARAAAWPSMPVLVAGVAVTDALAVLERYGAGAAAVVAADAPDLPPLLVGKLFSALTSWPVAVCPASDGSLVALAATLPAPAWLRELDMDSRDALAAVRDAAPSRGLHVAAGWHRIRNRADTQRLDAGLEGWDATRAWLASRPT